MYGLHRSTVVSPPKQLSSSVARQPCFGPEGDVYFLAREGEQESVYTVGPDETAPRKIDSEPRAEFVRISPHGDWWLSGSDSGMADSPSNKGGSPIRICSSCGAGWGPAEVLNRYVPLHKIP